ncbi:mucin-2 [Armigeres subalbatus]|uniref:mucin-2 n=1 Tax=Armigeres subalbatus TaxID=124917 RepID=UPI002ED1772A
MAIDVAKKCWVSAFTLVLSLTSSSAGERWSRQLTDYSNVQGNDWIPLSRPGDRQAGAKVLNYFDSTGFLGTDNNAQPQHQQFSYVNQPFGAQSSRVVFPPPPVAQPLQQELETAFNTPFGSHQSFIQHTPFGGVQTIQRHPLPPFSPQLPKENLVQEKPSLVEHQFQFPSQTQPQTTHLRQPSAGNLQAQPTGGVSQEEVQLLYVPVETLYNQKPASESTRYNALPQPVSASIINDFYTAATTTPKPRTTSTPYTTKATPSAALVSKPKPNQPPLAMFMYNDDKQSKLSVSDALSNLKNVNNIAVLDSLSKNLPKVFIGPSGLAPPKGYSKFELPYLSSIDQTRLSAKPGDLPFFVAPQSYKTPGGFSKIPLPAPHVGSVIVQQPLIQSNYFRQPDNIEYYQPSTLKFTDVTTKSPITLPVSKPQYDSDHYTSPTSKPTTDRSNYSRGNTQTPQESYRQPQTERALFSHSPFNSVNNLPNRHIVNEEYFNLAKTKKPTTPAPTQSYSPKTYKPFDFKPIPEQKIPLYPENDDFTTAKTTTTTEKPQTSRQEENRMKSYFKEENFRNRRPYTQSTVSTPYEDQEVTQSLRGSNENEGNFVHKFKLVDSVRPQTTPATKSVVDNAFLDFFQQDNHEMLKTVVSNQPSNGAQQIIRNNYFSQNTHDEPQKQKFVSTYYVPTTTSTTLRTTTPTPATTAEDTFFKEFEEKSKKYEPEHTRFPQTRLQNQEPFLTRFTDTSYTNKYKYETNTDDVNYPVEVVTTQEPARHETSNDVTVPPSEQSYSIPSELPPISANLPGLVNSLMEDEWPHKKGEQDTPLPTTTKGHFRKQIHRTTQATTTPEPYSSEVTTRRTRGRRPTVASSSSHESVGPTRGTTINRSRSRYVPADGENSSSGRSRTRSRISSSSSRNAKEEENLEYQRDVLKQNYPVIRPTSGSSTSTTTTPPPPPTTTTTTTHATTIPVTYQQIYEQQTERLSPYYSTPEPQSYPEEQAKTEEISIPRKEAIYTENYYEPEVTTTIPHTTYRQQYSPVPNPEEIDDESVRVLPVDHPIEPKRAKPVEIQREQPAAVTHTQSPRRQPARTPSYQLPEEHTVPVTPSYNSHEDEMEIQKVEITPRPRRPLSRQPVYSPRTTAHTERPTTERTTTELPPSSASSRGSSVQRRPAFVRRPARPLYTTTPAPTTTYSSRGVSTGDDELPTQGSYTVRPKSRQDVLRGRTRRPVTTTVATTTPASPEPPITRGFARNKDLRRVSPTIRSRQEPRERERDQRDQPAETTTTHPPRFRIRERTRFNLQPQESQWSTKLTQNSFQPVQSIESRSKNYDGERTSSEPEPEIVTASALVQEPQEDVRLVSVSANMGGAPTAQAESEVHRGSSNDGSEVVLKEVALSQEPPQADENEENSDVPTFAALLNDVMKEYIDSNLQLGEPENKPVENEVLIEEPKPVTTAPLRGSGERRPYNIRANFRKRGRSHVTESFETAESQHINTHVYNTAGFESLKNIDQAALQGKNLINEVKASSLVLEAPVNTTTTTTEAPVTELPETTTFAIPETTPIYETTSVLPTEREVTTTVPTIEAQSEGDAQQFSTEQFYDDEQDEQVQDEEDTRQGIFADVKKQLSDLFAMAENDPETEEVEDDDEQYRPQPIGSYHELEQASTESPITTTTTGSDVVANENRPEPVTEETAKASSDDAIGPMPIPTSTSNGITHETEICYRGRCIKTDEKKPKKNKFKPN